MSSGVESGKIQLEKCPTCEENYEFKCKCIKNHMFCPNRHAWKVCQTHNKRLLVDINKDHTTDILCDETCS